MHKIMQKTKNTKNFIQWGVKIYNYEIVISKVQYKVDYHLNF